MNKILLHTCCGPCAITPINYLIKQDFKPIAYYFNPNIHPQEEFQLRLNALSKICKILNVEKIIADNTNYFQAINTAFLTKNEINIYKTALENCAPFYFNHQKEKKWQEKIKKILTKWNNYKNKFNKFPTKVEVKPFLWIANLKIYQEKIRCKQCYHDRLLQTVIYATINNYPYFTTTLLYSRYQNHEDIILAAKSTIQEVEIMLEQNKIRGKLPKFYYYDFREFWQEGIDLSKNFEIYRQKYCGCILSRFESLVQMAKREFLK